MSFAPPTTCKEGIFQYCNYGYDKNKYSSIADCYKKRIGECPTEPISAPTHGAPEEEKLSQSKTPDTKRLVITVLLAIGIVIIYKNLIK
jgi:hypothetical protein